MIRIKFITIAIIVNNKIIIILIKIALALTKLKITRVRHKLNFQANK